MDLPSHISTRLISPEDVPLPREAEPRSPQSTLIVPQQGGIILPPQPRLWGTWEDHELSSDSSEEYFPTDYPSLQDEESTQGTPEELIVDTDSSTQASGDEISKSNDLGDGVMSARAGRVLSEELFVDSKMPAVNVRAGGQVVDMRIFAPKESSVQSAQSQSDDTKLDVESQAADTKSEVESQSADAESDVSSSWVESAVDTSANKQEPNSVSVLLGFLRKWSRKDK